MQTPQSIQAEWLLFTLTFNWEVRPWNIINAHFWNSTILITISRHLLSRLMYNQGWPHKRKALSHFEIQEACYLRRKQSITDHLTTSLCISIALPLLQIRHYVPRKHKWYKSPLQVYNKNLLGLLLMVIDVIYLFNEQKIPKALLPTKQLRGKK